jgi:hypothetical protein
VTFDASGTQGSVVEYKWDFDADGETDRVTSDATTSHVYTELGNYNATVTVVNADADESTATTTITVGDEVDPIAAIETSVNDEPTSIVAVGERFTVDASDSTDNHRLGTPYTWSVTDSGGNEVASDEIDEATTSFRLDEAGDYTVEVTVVDESGNENSTTKNIEVVDESLIAADIEADDQQRLQDGLNATVTVSNVGSSTTDGGFNWTLTATGDRFDDGTQTTRTITGSETQLDAGSSIEITRDDELTAWAQANENRTVGDVDLTFEINADGRTSNDSTTVDVTYSNLETDLNTQDTVEGVNVNLRSFITNTGTATSDNSTATVTVKNDTNDVVYSTTINQVSQLGAGEIQRDRFTNSFTDDGPHTLTVEAEDALFPENNSSTAQFTVHPYKLDVTNITAPAEVESGDEFLARLSYQTNASAPVNASVNVSNVDGLVHVDGQDLKQRSPNAGATDTVTWRLKATEYSDSDYNLNFSVESALDNIDESDSEVRTITSAQRTEVRTNSSSAIIQQDTNSASNTIRLYGDNSTVSQTLSVSLQAGAQGRTLKGVEYLVRYPYGCVEQTTSAFLGALSTDQYYRVRDDYNISDSQQDEINVSIEDGVKRLGANGARSQSSDGSWNMWGQSNRDGETFYSMYALYGLSEVHNDEVYGEKNSDGLNQTDFDNAVTWLKTEAQQTDGSFSGSDPGYYIGDDPGATGFALVSLTAANETAPDRISSTTQENVTEIYVNASNYLVGKQLNSDADSWANNERSTALAVWGLTQAYDAGVYNNDDFEYTSNEMKTAIEDGANYLERVQNDDGSWSPYQQNVWWSSTGDESETTAYAVLALNETTSKVVTTDNSNLTNATQNGTDFLTSTYESRGSWGYTRASSAAIKALTEVTSGTVDRTVAVTFENSTDAVTVNSGVSINSNSPTSEFELNSSQLSDVRDLLGDSESGTVTVNITDTGSGSGIVITGIENSQEVDLDVLAVEAGN